MPRRTAWLVLYLLAPALPLTEASAALRKVLIFGIDGCRPDALLVAKTPNLDRLAAEGAWSWRGQTGDVPISGPGWSSALTGVWRGKHGVDDNSFTGARYDLYPIVFCRLKEARPEAWCGSIIRWQPLQPNLIRCADQNLAAGSDAAAANEAIRMLSQGNPDLVFLHLNAPDGAGHGSGFSPEVPAYLQSIESVDLEIGRVLAALEARPRFAEEEWLVITTTDHGGSGKDHHVDIPENRTIFLIVSGAGASRGEIEPPPGIVDVAATALAHLGLGIDPAWDLDGRPVGLSRPPPAGLQLPGDCNQDARRDVTDALCLLGALFLIDPARGPCGEGGLDEPGNLAVLDLNADQALDLSDAVRLLLALFGGLPAPAAGCSPAAGCPEVCPP